VAVVARTAVDKTAMDKTEIDKMAQWMRVLSYLLINEPIMMEFI
jgi:hypothetical protein